MTTTPTSRAPGGPPALEDRVAAAGRELGARLQELLERVPEARLGPQSLAGALGLDKVFASRLLKSLRSKDPIAIAWHVPGRDPLRRFCAAVRARASSTSGSGVKAARVAACERAIEEFHALIREEVGDRSALDALISAWLPEAREEFELRRKQAAYRAMSQLRGISARTSLATVILHPSADGAHIDVVWIFGLLGLQRLRPGARIKLTTRRMVEASGDPDAPGSRRPTTLEGLPVDGPDGLRLDRFCDAPPARLEVRAVGETVHYLLADDEIGSRAGADLVLAEVDLAEIARYVPAEKRRKGYVFAEVTAPSRKLLFDVLVHEDVYPGSAPSLVLYDTALEGVADVNDPTRDVDRLDMAESIQLVGRGPAALRAPEVPNYVGLLRHVFGQMGWDGERFAGWRCRVDYPLYGSQVVAAFDPPPAPPSAPPAPPAGP